MAETINDLDFSTIKSLKDEHSYWSNLSIRYDLKADVIDRAHFFAEQLQPIGSKFVGINQRSLNEVLELIDKSLDAFDSVWKLVNFPVYPEARMVHIFKLFASSLNEYLLIQIGSLNIWSDPFVNIRETLRKCKMFSNFLSFL